MKTSAIKLDNWHLLRDWYAVFGDIEDIDALRDNFEAFDVRPLWMIIIDKRRYVMVGHEDLGLMFLKIPKWRREEAQAAFENYYRRMCWKHPDFEEIMAAMVEDVDVNLFSS